MAKKAVKKTTARKKTSANTKATKKKVTKSRTKKAGASVSAADEDSEFFAGLAEEESTPSHAVSLDEQEPGASVINCTRLPGGVVMQWGRSRAPASGAADHRVDFVQPFGGVPAVTSSFLHGRHMSAGDRYLLDVDDEGFNWRNINALGEIMWIAVGPEA